MKRRCVFFVLSVFISASHGAANVPVQSVALVPSAEPLEYPVTVKSSASFLIPLVTTATYIDSNQKTRKFTESMQAHASKHGALLTDLVAERLRVIGYQVTVMTDIKRAPKDPDTIDYEKFDFDADIALHIRIDAIGFYSDYSSSAYVPQLNVSAISFTKKGSSYPYEASVYFGVDAEPKKDWAIVSPASANFASFEDFITVPQVVNEIYRDALEKIAERIADQFRAASPLKVPAPSSPSG